MQGRRRTWQRLGLRRGAGHRGVNTRDPQLRHKCRSEHVVESTSAARAGGCGALRQVPHAARPQAPSPTHLAWRVDNSVSWGAGARGLRVGAGSSLAWRVASWRALFTLSAHSSCVAQRQAQLHCTRQPLCAEGVYAKHSSRSGGAAWHGGAERQAGRRMRPPRGWPGRAEHVWRWTNWQLRCVPASSIAIPPQSSVNEACSAASSAVDTCAAPARRRRVGKPLRRNLPFDSDFRTSLISLQVPQPARRLPSRGTSTERRAARPWQLAADINVPRSLHRTFQARTAAL